MVSRGVARRGLGHRRHRLRAEAGQRRADRIGGTRPVESCCGLRGVERGGRPVSRRHHRSGQVDVVSLERTEAPEDRFAVVECECSEVAEVADVVASGGDLGDDSAAVAVSDEGHRPGTSGGEMVEQRRHGSGIVVEAADRFGGGAVTGQVDRERCDAAPIEFGLQCLPSTRRRARRRGRGPPARVSQQRVGRNCRPSRGRSWHRAVDRR